MDWLAAKNAMFVVYAAEMKNKKSVYFINAFLKDEVMHSVHPSAWWSGAVTEAVESSIVDLASSLFVLPSGTASLERHFSTLGNIMTDTRSRLEVNKASKLCTVSSFLKSTQ